MSNELRKFSKKELSNIIFRWTLHLAIGFNFEKMEATGYLITMMPVMKKLYGDDPVALKEAYKTHAEFFNCETNLAAIIIGMDIAVEEKFGKEGLPMARNIKASLMGPFSGIGDTIFSAILNAVLGSIAVVLGLEGNFAGWIIWFVYNALTIFALRPFLINYAYEKGLDLASTISDKLRKLTDCGSILGLTVIGGMIATMVSMTFGSFTVAGLTFDMQTQMFDALIPKAGSVIAISIIYWLLNKKKVKTPVIFLGIVVISIICAYFGILVK